MQFSMKLGMTSETFQEKKEEILSKIAFLLGIPIPDVDVSIAPKKSTRRRLDELEVEVTMVSEKEEHDFSTVSNIIKSKSFADDVSTELSKVTGETVTVSDISEPVMEEITNSIIFFIIQQITFIPNSQ